MSRPKWVTKLHYGICPKGCFLGGGWCGDKRNHPHGWLCSKCKAPLKVTCPPGCLDGWITAAAAKRDGGGTKPGNTP